MSNNTTFLQQRLDEPLPPTLAGRGQGWFTQYRRWPVFSPAWARGRVRSFGLGVTMVLLIMMVPLVGTPLRDMPLGGLVQIAIQLFVPVLLGPWVGVLVRRCHWPAQQEAWALAAVMLALVLGVLAFHIWGAETVKQAVAELTGQVDETGKRKRMVMTIGLSVSTPDDVASAASSASAAAPTAGEARSSARFMNAFSSAMASFWLGGGAALWGRRREREGLAHLARERELEDAQARRREAELRLSVLAAQVEPHFLFNTLAGVRSAIATDPLRASDMIDCLVDYLRASIPRLRSSGGSEATLGGQLDIVRAYLGLMAARMPRLQWSVQADAELLALPCPPLMLISLAENAVKHGVEPKIGPARVEVRARREGGQLEITVADDGAGFGTSVAGSGLGLTNIRERLQQMYAGRAALNLKARPEGGVAAVLTLPLE
jgi:signal transduction histidine kinase